jgi:hypothetical protein
MKFRHMRTNRPVKHTSATKRTLTSGTLGFAHLHDGEGRIRVRVDYDADSPRNRSASAELGLQYDLSRI